MKSTSRDIWAIPPGGFDKKPSRRSWIKPAIASALVLSLGVGGGAIYASMKRSTAVSTDDAIAQFRAGAANPDDDAANQTDDSKTSKKQQGDASKKQQRRGRAENGGGAAVAAPAESGGGTGSGSTEQRASSEDGGDGGTKRTGAARPVVPEEGVYSWEVDGVERGPGVERRLPRKSHRIVTHKGGDRWEEHHIFSEQKELWFNLGTAGDGVYCSSARNKVTMGPVTIDRTVTFDPVMYVSRFPMDQGQTWDGRWDGKTRGTYTGRTIDHGTLTIDGKTVEVYVTEVEMQMKGEVEGRVLTRSWVAPEYSMVVKQYQESDVRSGPGNYYSEWEGQVLSLEPQR